MTIKRNSDWLVGNSGEVVAEGRETTGKRKKKTKANPCLRCKDQNRSPRGAHSLSPWRLFRTGEVNVCWELQGDCKELGENPREDRYQCAFLQCHDYQISFTFFLSYKCFHQQPRIYQTADRRLLLRGNAFTRGEWQSKSSLKVWREEKQLLPSTTHHCPISWLWATPLATPPAFQSNAKTHPRGSNRFLATGMLQFPFWSEGWEGIHFIPPISATQFSFIRWYVTEKSNSFGILLFSHKDQYFEIITIISPGQ